MGFSAGVLISAVALDLVEEAAGKASGGWPVVLGIFAGCAVFFLGDSLIDRFGGADRKDATGAQESGIALAIVLGTVPRRDSGVDRCIGLTIYEGGTVGAAYLAAVFISNLPESISSTAGLAASGWDRARILWLWIGIALNLGALLPRRLRAVPALVAEHDCIRARLRGRRDPHHARRHDDARGLRARR